MSLWKSAPPFWTACCMFLVICRLGLENYPPGYSILSRQNRWCTATLKMTALNLWSNFLWQKLHYLIGQSIWWQMSWSTNSITRWMHATLLWFLHPTWRRFVEFVLVGSSWLLLESYPHVKQYIIFPLNNFYDFEWKNGWANCFFWMITKDDHMFH